MFFYYLTHFIIFPKESEYCPVGYSLGLQLEQSVLRSETGSPCQLEPLDWTNHSLVQFQGKEFSLERAYTFRTPHCQLFRMALHAPWVLCGCFRNSNLRLFSLNVSPEKSSPYNLLSISLNQH